jgi:hypothetical protein
MTDWVMVMYDLEDFDDFDADSLSFTSSSSAL